MKREKGTGNKMTEMIFKYDDVVSVEEMNALLKAMTFDDKGRFPVEAIFHYSLRNTEKEKIALDYGINVTARNKQGDLAGYLRVISDRSYIHYIVDVMVPPGVQGGGVGSKLVGVAIDELKKQGFIKVLLTAIPGKEEFYKRMGFQETMSPVLALRGEDYRSEQIK